MTFFELMETAQAILVSLILTDGSAQAVSYTVDALKVIVRNLKLHHPTGEVRVLRALEPLCTLR